MSDYLTRLVARFNGSEAVLRPLLNREALRDLRDRVDPSAAPFEAGASPDSTERRARPEPHRLAEPVRTIERNPAPRSAPQRATPKSPAAVSHATQAIGDGEPQTRRPTFAPSATPAQLVREPFEFSETQAPENPTLRPRRRTVALATDAPEDVERERMTAAHAALPAPEHRFEPSGTAAPPSSAGIDRGPVIRIAIGRIEVRANVPRSSPAPAGNATAGRPQRRLRVEPKLTLDSYLRNGEARR